MIQKPLRLVSALALATLIGGYASGFDRVAQAGGIDTNLRVQLAGGDQVFSNLAMARPGETVNFKVFVRNAGKDTASAPRVSMDFGKLAVYVEGSASILMARNGVDQNVHVAQEKITKTGDKMSWSLPPLGAGGGVYVLFQAKMPGASTLSDGTYGLNFRTETTFGSVTKKSNNVVAVVSSPM